MKQHASFRPRKDSPKKESEMLDLEAFVVELFVLRNSCVPVVKNLLYRLVSFSGLVQPCGTNNVSETSLGQHPTVRDFCFFLFPFLKKTRRPPHSSAETQERGGELSCSCLHILSVYGRRASFGFFLPPSFSLPPQCTKHRHRDHQTSQPPTGPSASFLCDDTTIRPCCFQSPSNRLYWADSRSAAWRNPVVLLVFTFIQTTTVEGEQRESLSDRSAASSPQSVQSAQS